MAILSNIKVLWITIIILILLNLTTLGALWITRNHKPLSEVELRHRDKRNFLHNKLKLNNEQIKEFHEIRVQHRQQMGVMLDSIRGLREKLMCQMKKRDLNDSSRLLIHDIGVVQSDIEQLNYEHFRDILNICDSTQKAIFIETMRKAFLPDHDNDRKYRSRQRDDKDDRSSNSK